MRRTIGQLVADRAAAAPQDVVVIDAAGALTARQLDARSTSLAHALIAAGVGTDDLVAVSLPNGADFVVACAAIWKAGATPQPLSMRLADEQRTQIEQLQRPAAAIGRPPADAAIPWFPTADAPDDQRLLPALAAASWKAPATSGSTGRPKIVKAAGPALLDPAQQVAPFLPRSATQLVAGPLTHSATFTYAFRGLLTGHALVVLPRFEERAWMAAVERHEITWALVVPTMMHRLLRLPAAERAPARLRSLETVLHIGAPCAPALKRRFLRWVGPERVVEVYAGTESNGLTMIRGDEWLEHEGSVGRPIGGTELDIRSPDGHSLAPGIPGRIWMRRGDAPAYSYVGGASRRDPHGWDTLGDLGRLDDDGYLFILDREDDVINRGGEKVYPAVIESALERHPSVRSAVAFGLADEEWGQRIHAVVDIGERAPTESGLRAWAAAELGHLAPDSVHLVRDPVRDDAGKTSRRAWADRVRALRMAAPA